MTELSSKASLYKKIAAVAGAIAAVEKDGRNQDQKYRYPTPASVMTAVKPLMAAQHLAIVPHLVDFAEIDSGQRSGTGKPFMLNRVSMHYHILDGETGEEIVVPWQAQAGTYADDKGLAKAQTIALRTFLIQLFQIPAEDPEHDPDARDARPMQERPTQARPTPQQPPRPQPAQQPAQAPADDRPKLIKALKTLWAEERGLGGQVPTADYVVNLETASRDELIKLGKAARARVAKLQEQALPAPKGMPLEDLPPITDDERAAVAA